MKKTWMIRFAMMLLATLLVGATVHEASARVGGGRSMGSRGSRSFSSPSRSSSPAPAPSYNPGPNTYQQPMPQRQGGGFLRSMAGGLAGGLLGGMLFRSLGFGGGMGAGGGIGIFDIILIGGILYLIYRFISSRRRQESVTSQYQQEYRQPTAYEQPQQQAWQQTPPAGDSASGISHIRQMDGSFDENRFRESAQDIFFKVQGAWTRRDLAPVRALLAPELTAAVQKDLDDLKQRGQINRLENIAVREVEIVEAWQEQGQDFITVRMLASLLDYTTDETGKVLTGSDSDPVKFEEFWTFTRPVGPNQWLLSAINQA